MTDNTNPRAWGLKHREYINSYDVRSAVANKWMGPIHFRPETDGVSV